MRFIHLVATATFTISSPIAVLAADTAPALVDKPSVVSRTKPMLALTPEQADKVGRQVWRNETGGSREAITAWNAAENFASLGIGHFIWFPEGLDTPFKESFPALLEHLRRRGATLPAWLDTSPIPRCPWTSRAEFKRNFRSQRMTELRTFLLKTVGLQAEFLILRMQAALPDIIATLPNAKDREHVRRQFSRVANASPDLYPLVDYINFKGEGTSEKETYPNQLTGEREGWGLKQVLLEMRGVTTDSNSVLNDFSAAAGYVLKRRVQNNPPNRRWLRGWLARTKTYRRPLK